jgi:tetratricopeptide (TPR) repeat protein
MGQTGEAEALLRAVLSENPVHTGARLGLAQLLMDIGRFDEARSVLEPSSGDVPADAASEIMLGHIARRRGDRQAALARFEAALARDPEHVGAQTQIAIELAHAGRFSEAHGVIGAILAKRPTDRQALTHKGYLLRSEGRREAAAKTFSEILAHHPDDIQVLVELAIERRALGNPADCARLLQRALASNPVHLEALMQSAENAALAQDYGTALETCQRAIAAHPLHVAAYLSACRAAAELGRRDLAMQFLDAAEAACGQHPQIMAKRVELCRRERDWAGARALLERTGQTMAQHFCLWAERVQLAIVTGDDNAADKAFERVPAGTVEERSRASVFRGQLAEARWQLEEALAHYRQAIALQPGIAGDHFAASRVCLKLLDFAACRDHLAQSVRLNTSMNIVRRLSQNISQTHVGQLLDEFTIDRAVLAGLESLRNVSPEGRIAPLQDLVRQNPDNTAPAIMLLIALRQSGRLDIPKAVQSISMPRIPRRIVQFWHEQTLPDDVCAKMKSWRDGHPEFEYCVFDDQTAAAYLSGKHGEDVRRAFERVSDPVQRADIFRLAYLAGEGGFYAEVDNVCFAGIGTFVPPVAVLVVAQEQHGGLSNNFIGATPGHPVISTALRVALEEVNRGDHDMVWLSTGPGLLTRAFGQILSDSSRSLDALADTVIFRLGPLQRFVAFWYPLVYKRSRRRSGRKAFAAVANRLSSSR